MFCGDAIAPDGPVGLGSIQPLARACMHTLARSVMNDRSAAELADDLPYVGVVQGVAKVRFILRTRDGFEAVWSGRCQLGGVASVLAALLAIFAIR